MSWINDYWPLAINAYLAPPAGPKSCLSRPVIDLAVQLHMKPADIADRLGTIHSHGKPAVERLLQHYTAHPKLLKRDVARLLDMSGFGLGSAFYEGVCTAEQGFEHFYRPIAGTPFTEAMLTLLLDLYFRLVPATMIESTPEVRDMARRTGLAAARVVEVLHAFRDVDPCTRRRDTATAQADTAQHTADATQHAADAPTLGQLCRDTWQRLGNGDPMTTAAEARRFMEYYD